MNGLTHYEILQVTVDASDEVIRAAYRALAKKHHPDVGGSPEVMKRLNLALEVLTDPVKRRQYDLIIQATTARKAPNEGEWNKSSERAYSAPQPQPRPAASEPPNDQSGWRWIAGVGAGAILLVLATWWSGEDRPTKVDDSSPSVNQAASSTNPFLTTPKSPSANTVRPASGLQAGGAASNPLTVPQTPVATPSTTNETSAPTTLAPASTAKSEARSFSLGSTKEEVIQIMGPPDKLSAHSLGYKFSTIYFDNNDQVNGWSDISRILRVSMGDRTPGAPPFSLGSTFSEVLAAMGTPQKFAMDSWGYEFSTVYFSSDGRVTGWSNISKNLNVTLGQKRADVLGFGVGSSKGDVLAAMGTPDKINGQTWGYDFSSVHFDANGRVQSWSNISQNLKLR